MGNNSKVNLTGGTSKIFVSKPSTSLTRRAFCEFVNLQERMGNVMYVALMLKRDSVDSILVRKTFIFK